MEGANNLVFIAGQRGNFKLVLDGYSYVRSKDYRDTSYYRCSQRKYKCKARIIVNRTNDEIVMKTLDHTHPPDFD